MITKRLLVLLAVFLIGIGCVILLPKHLGSQPVGIALMLPVQVGDWYGEDSEVTLKEKQVLGPETEFARKLYTNSHHQGLFVSIVLSGHDVNTSLHRPERCLTAQGWDNIDKGGEAIPLDDGTTIHATRMFNRATETGPDKKLVDVFGVYYYWFVGYKDVVASPFQRSMIDWRDRVFRGYDQRWAYITVATELNTDRPEIRAATDDLVKRFIAELFPKIWKPAGSPG
jgi:EpsI family protein